MPQIAIIDPRTRAKVVSMKGYASPQEMIAFLVRFLEDNDINANKAAIGKTVQNNIDLQQRALDRSSRLSGDGMATETPPGKFSPAVAAAGDGSAASFLDLASVARSLEEDIGSPPAAAAAAAAAAEKGQAVSASRPGVEYGVAPAEPAEGALDSCKVQLKLPNGKAVKRRFLKSESVRALHAVARDLLKEEEDEEGAELGLGQPFQLATMFPAKVLSHSLDSSIAESGAAGAQIVVRNV
jgi:hypothetical protein